MAKPNRRILGVNKQTIKVTFLDGSLFCPIVYLYDTSPKYTLPVLHNHIGKIV